MVAVPIVNASNTADDVTETPLGMVGIDAGARHQGPRRSPKIVHHPATDTALRIEPLLALLGAADCTDTIEAKDKLSISDAWELG
jgi:hypothetical protein